MSAFYLLGIIAIWGALTSGLWMLWRRNRETAGSNVGKIDTLFTIGALAWFTASFWYGGGRKHYYDAEVERLCAIDGGVKVYETVKLPADRFNEWGQPNFYNPTLKERALGKEYEFVSDLTYIHNESPSLHRFKVMVFRQVDHKLLGESIGYSRGGGGHPWPLATIIIFLSAGVRRYSVVGQNFL